MLEHVPAWLGSMLKGVRAGADKLTILQPDLGIGDARIDLRSPAFADGGRLPPRFTSDGEGISPPLVWNDPPIGTAGFALIVEDPDAPAPAPLVHAVLWGLPADERRIEEGAIRRDGVGSADGRDVGRNSFLGEGWLPPDPPPGHGDHRYVFQLFALSQLPPLDSDPGRGDLIRAIAGHVLAAGMLTGLYARGRSSPIVGEERFGGGLRAAPQQ